MPGLFFYPLPRRSHRTPRRAFLLRRGINIPPTQRTPHREPHRATEDTPRKHPRKHTETPPRAATPPRWGLIASVFERVSGEVGRRGFRPSDPLDLPFVRLCAIFSIFIDNAIKIPLFEFLCVLCVAKRTIRGQNDLLFVRIAKVVLHKEDAGDRVDLAVLHIIDHLKIE